MKVLWTRTPGSEEIPFFEELKSLYPSAEFKLAENIEQELKYVRMQKYIMDGHQTKFLIKLII